MAPLGIPIGPEAELCPLGGVAKGELQVTGKKIPSRPKLSRDEPQAQRCTPWLSRQNASQPCDPILFLDEEGVLGPLAEEGPLTWPLASGSPLCAPSAPSKPRLPGRSAMI